jgi:hypothetical protein
MSVPGRRARAIAILLAVAAGLFVIAVTSERGKDAHHDEPAAETGAHDEATESAESPVAEHARSETGTDTERVLGTDVESPLAIAIALVGSLVLAGLVWRRPDRRLLALVAVVAATFAVLDIAEVIHQLGEERTGLAMLAGVIAALHGAAAVLAVQLATTKPTPTPVHEHASS